MSLTRVSELDFGYEIFMHKGYKSLDAVYLITRYEGDVTYYIPAVPNYCGDGEDHYITGAEFGYDTQEEALRCVGRCLDKAKFDAEERQRQRSR